MSTRADPRWVYRPLLDLIGRAEGTDPVDGNPPGARGYNETLGYGAFTGGPVELVAMTLDEIDALQTAMLRHSGNRFNSSAIGRYQIVRATLRSIRHKLRLSGKALFDRAMQDRLACFLLGRRGIDAWLGGRMRQAALIDALAREWASFPTMEGTGHYAGQGARISLADVRRALAEARRRHETGSTPAPVPEPPPGPFGDPTLETILALAERQPGDLDRAARMLGLARAIQDGWQVRAPANAIPDHPTTTTKEKTEMRTKSLFQSKTIWGLAVAAISMWSPAVGQVLNLFGVGGGIDIDPGALNDIRAGIEQLIAAAGLIFAAWGRLVADTEVTITGAARK